MSTYNRIESSKESSGANVARKSARFGDTGGSQRRSETWPWWNTIERVFSAFRRGMKRTRIVEFGSYSGMVLATTISPSTMLRKGSYSNSGEPFHWFCPVQNPATLRHPVYDVNIWYIYVYVYCIYIYVYIHIYVHILYYSIYKSYAEYVQLYMVCFSMGCDCQLLLHHQYHCHCHCHEFLFLHGNDYHLSLLFVGWFLNPMYPMLLLP